MQTKFTAPGFRLINGRAYWVARPDLVKRGYLPRTVRLHYDFDDPAERAQAEARCRVLQAEMLEWASGPKQGARSDGTVKGLLAVYQTDQDSPYRKLRHKVGLRYAVNMAAIERTVGGRVLATLGGRDFLRWFDNWAQGEDGARHIPRAHGLITMLRLALKFGVVLELPHCDRLCTILSTLQFEVGRPRTIELTAEHALSIRAEAHRCGLPSMALAQALMFDLLLRQKDVIGEWMPQSEPGMSDVTLGHDKWLYGITWANVTPDLVLTHRLSKSLRGRHAIMDPRAGKAKAFDLKLYPMVMQELQHVPAEQRVGPIVKDEATGLPWRTFKFRQRWRAIARAAGVPDEVQNRDSRAGGITEGIEATGGDIEAARKAAGHAQASTTARYSRGDDRATAKVAVLRAERRKRERPE